MTDAAQRAAAPSAALAIADILADAAAKATAQPAHDPKDVLGAAVELLTSPESKAFVAKVAALHSLLGDAEPARQALANIVGITAAGVTQVKTRLEALTKAVATKSA